MGALFLIKQGKGAGINTFGLLLFEEHFMVEQLILEVFKTELFVSGHDGNCGNEAVEGRIQPIDQVSDQVFIRNGLVDSSQLI